MGDVARKNVGQDGENAELHQRVEELQRLAAHYQHKAAMIANKAACLQAAYDQLEGKCRAMRAHMKNVTELMNCCPP